MQLVSVTVNLTLNMSILDLQWNNIKINLHGIDFFRTLYNNFLSKLKTFLLLKKKNKLKIIPRLVRLEVFWENVKKICEYLQFNPKKLFINNNQRQLKST